MDEADVQRRARGFIAKLDLANVRRDLSVYVAEAKARVREEELGRGEAGFTATKKDGTHVITLNSADAEVRRRFTICHEIAHVVLGLPSNHDEVPSWMYAKRDPNEIACDAFAAELLMPHKMWRGSVPDCEPTEEVISSLAAEFHVSFPAAASRYAALAEKPCAFVTMERGIIKYAARSGPLRRAGAQVRSRSPIPTASVAHGLRVGGVGASSTGTVAQDVWFDDWDSGYDLIELARHHPRYDTTMSFLWFDDDELPDQEIDRFGSKVVEDELLPELTGELQWPGKRRRR